MDVWFLCLSPRCVNLYIYHSMNDGYELRTDPLGIQWLTGIQIEITRISVVPPISPENMEIDQENIYLILE